MALGGFGDLVNAQAETFSIDDYGYGPPGPFRIMEPAYPAPKFVGDYVDLGKALRECQTLCTLTGRPYRVVRWGREGSGNRGGVPCKTCKPMPGGSRFPLHRCPCGASGLDGLGGGCNCAFAGLSEEYTPVAEFRPGGESLVYDASGNARVVGRPNYVVSRNPFPRIYDPRQPTKRYMDAVLTGQALANRDDQRVFICSDFGADCLKEAGRATPVVYVDPGGFAPRYPQDLQGTVVVNPVSEAYFQELVAEGRGRSRLGWGS